jgi:hypothetical protein
MIYYKKEHKMDTPGNAVVPGTETTPGDNKEESKRNVDPWLDNIKAEAAKSENPMEYITKELANAEKRRRDTAGEFHKQLSKAKTAEAKIEILTKELDSPAVLTSEQQEELDALMYEDPKEWRKKLNSLEAQSKFAKREAIEKLTEEAGDKVSAQTEIERREDVLKNFTKLNSDIKITNDVISNDIPPRITNKLVAGKVSFEVFLEEVADYMRKGVKVKDNKIDNLPNLSDVAGGSTPNLSKDQISKDNNKDWQNEML